MGGLTILVVDDDPMMLHMLPPVLSELTQPLAVESVVTALTPQHALEALAGLRAPLAVLSDFNLKNAMNGVDLLQEVARRRPEAVRILFSGYARDQIGNVGSATHAFVEKPLRIRDLVPEIEAILSTHLRP